MSEGRADTTTIEATEASNAAADPNQTDRSSSTDGAGAATDGAGQVSGEGGRGVGADAPASEVPSGSRARADFSSNSGEFLDRGNGRREAMMDRYNVEFAAALRDGLSPVEASARAQELALSAVYGIDHPQKNFLSSVELAGLAERLGLAAQDRSAGAVELAIPPMPAEFTPDKAVLVLRSGAHVVSFDVTAHSRLGSDVDVDDFNETVRFVLWGMRHGLRLPDPLAPKPVRSELCPACGARPHFQDRRLADPKVEALVKEATL